jgi:hypothetical protein
MTKATKAPVSRRALIQRINRQLAKQDEHLRINRSTRWPELGTYYIVDIRRNTITVKDVDLEAKAQELSAIRDWEALTE